MKFYTVVKGYNTGIYTSWKEAEKQINGFSGAVFKGFKTKEEAEKFMKNHLCSKPQNGIHDIVEGLINFKAGIPAKTKTTKKKLDFLCDLLDHLSENGCDPIEAAIKQGKITSKARKICKKKGLAFKKEFKNRVKEISYSEARKHAILAIRTDFPPHPALLTLGPSRLITLSVLTGKGNKVSKFLIENDVELSVDLANQREIRGFIAEVDELLSKLESNTKSASSKSLDITPVSGKATCRKSVKKYTGKLKFSSLHKRSTTAVINCFNLIKDDPGLLDQVEPDELQAIKEKLENSFAIYRQAVEISRSDSN